MQPGCSPCSAASRLALGFTFFFEYMDSRIKTPDELKAHLGLPYLGMVPALSGKAALDPLINNGVPANLRRSVPRRSGPTCCFRPPKTAGGRSW